MEKKLLLITTLFMLILPINRILAARFVTLSTVKCRPLAMGGAFTAVNDHLAAFAYNPATFKQYDLLKDFRLTVFLNPVVGAVSLVEQEKLSAPRDLGKSLGLFFKGITFSAKYLEGGVFLSEEAIQNYPLNTREKMFSAKGFWDDFSHTIGLRLALAPQVALGMATTFYRSNAIEGEPWQIGNSYGVLLKPDNKISVGVFYVAFPKDYTEQRVDLERLVNDTVNIGLAYYPGEKTTLSLDIRNINNEDNTNSRELHFGGEQVWGSFLAIRAGYFQPRPQKHTISGGIGLLSDNFFYSKKNQLHPQHFILDYTWILEKEKSANSTWHLFSLTIRF